jgi:hypothetical protein
MRQRGFGSHAAMGAVLLGGVWLAVYLPGLNPALRAGGWTARLALAAGLVGVLGGPLLLVATEGDELLGALGIPAALRLWGAALGPVLLYGGLSVLFRVLRKRD